MRVVPSLPMAPNWTYNNSWTKVQKKSKPKGKGKGKGKYQTWKKPTTWKWPQPKGPKGPQQLPSSQGGMVAKSKGMARIGHTPIIWKVACADAPTRATQDYSRIMSSYKALAPTFPDNFSDDTVFLYMPDFAASQLVCINALNLPVVKPADVFRNTGDANWFNATQAPNLFATIPAYERVAQLSASLTISTRYPGSSGQLNIRRITDADCHSTMATLALSLKSDLASTYHLPLVGNQRWNMHCGVHSSHFYGELHRTTNDTWDFANSTALGGLLFSFTNTLTGVSIAQPGISVLTGSQWTQELTPSTAYTKDNAPERSVTSAKNLHSHQARMAPFETKHEHPEKASLGVMNSLQHGFESATKTVSDVAGAAEGGLGLISAGINAASVVNRGIALATAAL